MSCSTTWNKDGGVTILIDRPEIYLREVRDKDGKIVEEECFVKEQGPLEGPCKHRGKVTKTVPCCGGKTRPVAHVCNHAKTPSRVSTQVCHSKRCRYHEALELIPIGG